MKSDIVFMKNLISLEIILSLAYLFIHLYYKGGA